MSKYLLLIIILLNGCELFTNYRTINVSFPNEPPPWFQDSNKQTGIVLYPGTSGLIESSVFEWKGSFSIEIEKGSFIPIACYPSGCLKPAGTIITKDLSPGQNLELNWEDGFLTNLLLDLIKKEVEIEHLNINKLIEEIQIKAEGDPWSINKDLLMDAIIYNSLSVYKIKSGIRQDITLPIGGSWISDNPFFPISISNLQGQLSLEGIYPGLHRFVNPEAEEQLDILVWDDGYEYLLH